MAKCEIVAGFFDMERGNTLNLPPQSAKKIKNGKDFMEISLIPNTKEIER